MSMRSRRRLHYITETAKIKAETEADLGTLAELRKMNLSEEDSKECFRLTMGHRLERKE